MFYLSLVSCLFGANGKSFTVTGKPAKASDYVLVPFVDSMNHVTSAKTELSFSPISGDLGVSVNRYVGACTPRLGSGHTHTSRRGSLPSYQSLLFASTCASARSQGRRRKRRGCKGPLRRLRTCFCTVACLLLEYESKVCFHNAGAGFPPRPAGLAWFSSLALARRIIPAYTCPALLAPEPWPP